MRPMRDIELAYHFPDHISRQKRDRLARWGAIFILFATVGVPLFIIFLRG